MSAKKSPEKQKNPVKETQWTKKEKLMVAKRKNVTVKLSPPRTQNNKVEIIYEGRLLGLIDDIQFSCLLGDKEIQEKFLTMESMELRAMAESFKDLCKAAEDKKEGFESPRIALLVRKKNSETTDKQLFVSDKCEGSGAIVNKLKELSVTFHCEDKSSMEVTEIEV